MSILAGRERGVWKKFGLFDRSSIRRGESARHLSADSDRAEHLRLAFEELGGLYAAFGIFLAGRWDLLPATHLPRLESISQPLLEVPSQETLAKVASRFPEATKIGHSLYSIILETKDRERPILLEVFARTKGNPDKKEWRAFSRGIHLLKDSPARALVQPQVLDEFKYWLQLHCDIHRKRQMLGTLQGIPKECLCRFPRLISELQSDHLLAYEALEGKPLSELWNSGSGDIDGAELHVKAVVEQLLFLSTLAAQLRPESLVVMDDKRLGYRLCPAMDSVPPSHHPSLLRYAAAVVAGEDNQACRRFVEIARAQGSDITERGLWKELGGLGIETDGSLPESLERMRDFWRAASRQGSYVPSFLQIFHSNLLLVGRIQQEFNEQDFIPASIWSVLTRLIEFRFSDLFKFENGKEWFLGGGLMALATARQISSLLERFRDQEFAVQIRSEASERAPKRRWGRLTGGILLVALFLILSQLSFQLSKPFFQALTGFLALGSGLGLMILILRMK